MGSGKRLKMMTVLEQILGQAARKPQARALTLIDADGEEKVMTYADLERASWRMAAALRQWGLSGNELVLLLINDLAELVPLFFGAMMIGALPAILPVPVAGAARKSSSQLRERMVQAKARLLVTSVGMRPYLEESGGVPQTAIVVTSELRGEPADVFPRPLPDLSETAYVQFTSGTTGQPKGLQVSQGALASQVRHYAHAVGLNAGDVMVSWSPLYHDQGLVSNMLMPLCHGVHTILMTVSAWLRNPALFFQAVDRYQGTISRWPNFAFLYTARRVTDRQMASLSLRSLRLLASSGEPITPDAWPVFKERFAPYGLADEVMKGSYGMAEYTLCIAMVPLEERQREEALSLRMLNEKGLAVAVEKGGKGSQVFVSSGKAMEGAEIRIVDERGEFCADRVIGEIVVRGDCLIDRYHPDRPFPEDSFCNGFFRTGDLGYMVDGWLTVTGRRKDVVIAGGNCISPEQVERIAAGISAIKPGRAIAFGIPDEQLGTEKLTVVCELVHDDQKTRQDVRCRLQEEVLRELAVWLGRVEFREPGWIEKTTSGKLSRYRNREKLLSCFQENRPATSG